MLYQVELRQGGITCWGVEAGTRNRTLTSWFQTKNTLPLEYSGALPPGIEPGPLG